MNFSIKFNFKTFEQFTISDPVNKLSSFTLNLIYEEKKNKKIYMYIYIIQKSPQLPKYSGSSNAD